MRGFLLILCLVAFASQQVIGEQYVVTLSYWTDNVVQCNMTYQYAEVEPMGVRGCYSFTSGSSWMYQMVDNQLQRFLCDDSACNVNCRGYAVATNSCRALGAKRDEIAVLTKAAELPSARAPRGSTTYMYYYVVEGYPTYLINGSKSLVQYKTTANCTGTPNSVTFWPGSCWEACTNGNITSSCSIPPLNYPADSNTTTTSQSTTSSGTTSSSGGSTSSSTTTTSKSTTSTGTTSSSSGSTTTSKSTTSSSSSTSSYSTTTTQASSTTSAPTAGPGYNWWVVQYNYYNAANLSCNTSYQYAGVQGVGACRSVNSFSQYYKLSNNNLEIVYCDDLSCTVNCRNYPVATNSCRSFGAKRDEVGSEYNQIANNEIRELREMSLNDGVVAPKSSRADKTSFDYHFVVYGFPTYLINGNSILVQYKGNECKGVPNSISFWPLTSSCYELCTQTNLTSSCTIPADVMIPAGPSPASTSGTPTLAPATTGKTATTGRPTVTVFMIHIVQTFTSDLGTFNISIYIELIGNQLKVAVNDIVVIIQLNLKRDGSYSLITDVTVRNTTQSLSDAITAVQDVVTSNTTFDFLTSQGYNFSRDVQVTGNTTVIPQTTTTTGKSSSTGKAPTTNTITTGPAPGGTTTTGGESSGVMVQCSWLVVLVAAVLYLFVC